jgi:hypothetical protein
MTAYPTYDKTLKRYLSRTHQKPAPSGKKVTWFKSAAAGWPLGPCSHEIIARRETKIVDMEIEVICQQNRLTTFNIQTHMLGPKKE